MHKNKTIKYTTDNTVTYQSHRTSYQ